MKRLTSQEIDERDARDLLEDAVAMSAALLDSVAAMLEIQVDCGRSIGNIARNGVRNSPTFRRAEQ